MFLSVFDVYKIGIGPSSSHTVGPMKAAARFIDALREETGGGVDRLVVSLHGSLAFTGKGHGSDKAIILGLVGETPETIDPDQADAVVERLKQCKKIKPLGLEPFGFDPDADLVFDYGAPLPGHSNGMIFGAFDSAGKAVLERMYYSIGGGFVATDEELQALRADYDREATADVPYPFASAKQMLAMGTESGLTIAQMKRANEAVFHDHKALDAGIDGLLQAMDACLDRGLSRTGELPGGLHVRRRAREIHEKLQQGGGSNTRYEHTVMDWLGVYAMAVNEENAAGGRIVTAPTNGAAGVVPAVLRYYRDHCDGADAAGLRDFMLTSAAIGGIIKHNASISGAEVGCQGEVGSAAAMAAAGLCAALGGSNRHIENAAEIALEHHLGMTCDPIGGLVQVPCIERNALGAVKAVTAASMALHGDGDHIVSLDSCIETMRQTGIDMHSKYKETSEGGLAANVVEC
jgi:L-serine dehydratase